MCVCVFLLVLVFICLVWGPHPTNSAQGLLLILHSRITTDWFGEWNEMLGIKPGLATCKVNTYPLYYFSHPSSSVGVCLVPAALSQVPGAALVHGQHCLHSLIVTSGQSLWTLFLFFRAGELSIIARMSQAPRAGLRFIFMDPCSGWTKF